MKPKRMVFLPGVLVLAMILMAGHASVWAAPPTGEVKTVAPTIGNGVPIPSLEVAAANDWMQLLYDHLVGVTPEGKPSPDVGLANRWEMSRDGLTWALYLRKGVKFHDGVEVTAKDVKFSIEQLMLPAATVSEAPFLRKILKNIEVKDPYTVVIHCKQADIFLLSQFNNLESPAGMVIPKDYFERVGKDEFAKHPIGSGPYKWHSQTMGSSIKLEAAEKHWREGVPRYKYMTYLVIPEESTRLAMLKTGEADIARISREVVKDAMDAGLNILTKETGGVLVFHTNMQWTSPAFSDIRFRKALNFALDKEAIIKQIFSGMAKPLGGYPGSAVSAVGGDPALKPYPYDPQEARRLIKEGGWEGYEFSLISYDRPGCPEFHLVVEALAGFWQKVGLKPKIVMSEWSTWRERWRDRKTQNSVHGYEGTTNPDAGMLLIKFQEKWSFKNPRSTANLPELNQRFERIEKSMDPAEISRLMAEIYRIAYDQYLMIPICEYPHKIATTKRIPKWDPGLLNDRNYYALIRQR